MNLFDLISNQLAPTTTTAKGSIVTVSKNDTKVWDKISSTGKVLKTYNAGKILGTVQEVNKIFVVENGKLTNRSFLGVRVKLSEPIKTVPFQPTYTDVWTLAENLDVFAEANKTTPSTTSNATEYALYCTGNGVRVRTDAKVVGQVGQLGNNIITSYQKGDLIGYTDKKVSNGFYKVRFLTPQTKKEDGKKYESGYISTAYSSVSEPIITPKSSVGSVSKSTIQDEKPKTVENDKVSGISASNSSNTGSYRNRYGLVLIGAGIVGLFGVLVWAIKSLSKSNKNGSIKK